MEVERNTCHLLGAKLLERTPLILTPGQQKLFAKNISKLQNLEEEKTLDPNVEKQLIKEFKREKKMASFQTIVSLLKKSRYERSKVDIKIISDYFCSNYAYFIKLKEDSDLERCQGLVGVLNLEKFEVGERIISFGEPGEKFYIIIQGRVGVYKPKFSETMMTLKEFIIYLCIVKFKEKNEYKLFRVEEANMKNANIFLIRTVNYDYTKLMDLNSKKHFYIEDDQYICDKERGYEFGEVALRDRTTRTATIKALEPCLIVSLNKHDYNHSMRKYEERKTDLILEDYRKSFLLINSWSRPVISKLYNFFSKVTLENGQILYEQNSSSNDIYFVISGSFELTSWISVSSFKLFEEYIMNSRGSLLNHLAKNKININDLDKIKRDLTNYIKPFRHERHGSHAKLKYKKKKENLFDLKLEEENFKEGTELFPVKLRHLDFRDIIGLEEAVELKTRFSTVRCVSSSGELMKLKLDDFVQLLNNFDIKLSEISSFISERKSILLKQLRNSFEVKVNSKVSRLYHQYNRFFLNVNEKEYSEEIRPKWIRLITTRKLNNFCVNSSGIETFEKNDTVKGNSNNKSNNLCVYNKSVLNESSQNLNSSVYVAKNKATKRLISPKKFGLGDSPNYKIEDVKGNKVQNFNETKFNYKHTDSSKQKDEARASVVLNKNRQRNSYMSLNLNNNSLKRASFMFKSLEEKYFSLTNSDLNNMFSFNKDIVQVDNSQYHDEIDKIINPGFKLNSRHRNSFSKNFDGKLIKIEPVSSLLRNKNNGPSRLLTPAIDKHKRNKLKINSLDSLGLKSLDHSKPKDNLNNSLHIVNKNDNHEANKKIIRIEIPLDIRMKDFKRLRKKKNKLFL